MKKVVFAAVLVAGCGGRVHHDIKVTSEFKFDNSEAHPCMISTGQSPVKGDPTGPDPKAMYCGATALNPLTTVQYVADVHLDDKSEEVFRDNKHFGVSMLCTRISEREFSCVFDGETK